jgi:hypothetical protein
MSDRRCWLIFESCKAAKQVSTIFWVAGGPRSQSLMPRRACTETHPLPLIRTDLLHPTSQSLRQWSTISALGRPMLDDNEKGYFAAEQALHEQSYLAGTNPRQQSGFGRDERDWGRFRRAVTMAIDRDGTFLDVGCANGLLMESVVGWAAEDGHSIEPYGLDISRKLAEPARRRLPHWPGPHFRRERTLLGSPLQVRLRPNGDGVRARPSSTRLRRTPAETRRRTKRMSYHLLIR